METLLQFVIATDDNLRFIAEKMVDGIPVFLPTDSGYLLCSHYSKSPNILLSYLARYPLNRREVDEPFIVSMGAHDALPLLLSGETWNPQQNPAHQPLYSLVSELPAPMIIEYNNRRLSAPTYSIAQKLLEFLYAPMWAYECVGITNSDDIHRIYGHIPAYCIRENDDNYNRTIKGRDMTIVRVENTGSVILRRHGAMKIVDMPYSIQASLSADLDEQEKTNRLLKIGIIFKDKDTKDKFLNNQFGKDDMYMRGIYLDPLARQRDRMDLRSKYMGYVTLSNANSIDDAEEHFYEVLWKCFRVRGMACIIVNMGDLPTAGECLLRNMIIRYCDIIM